MSDGKTSLLTLNLAQSSASLIKADTNTAKVDMVSAPLLQVNTTNNTGSEHTMSNANQAELSQQPPKQPPNPKMTELIEKKRKLTLTMPNINSSNSVSVSSDTSSISSDSSSNYLANMISANGVGGGVSNAANASSDKNLNAKANPIINQNGCANTNNNNSNNAQSNESTNNSNSNNNSNNNNNNNNNTGNNSSIINVNKRLKIGYNQQDSASHFLNNINLMNQSISITETPSMAKDLVTHLDMNNNISTPQIEKLLADFGANGSYPGQLKTPSKISFQKMYFFLFI